MCIQDSTIRLYRLISLLFCIFILPLSVNAECVVDASGTYIEAENFSGDYQLDTSPASENYFLTVTSTDYGNGTALQSNSGGYAADTPGNEVKEYDLNFPTTGTYQIWMRGQAGGDGSTDSMFFTIDNDTWKAWNFSDTSLTDLTWTSSMQVATDNDNSFEVTTAGVHTLKIAMREPNTIIDGFYITTGAEEPDDTFMDSANKTVLDPLTGCTGPYWSTDPNQVGVTNFVGYNAPSTSIIITNDGDDDTQAATISVDESWAIVDSTSMDPLLEGESHTINLSFSTSSLAAGSYTATVTVTGEANNSPLNIPITLLVKEAPSTAACGEVPLYAQNLVNPAIMVQLDVSGSMATSMSLATTDEQDTPNLSSIVQDVIDRTGWASNNALGFLISGTGSRRTWSYDGYADDAPVLTIEYDISGVSYNIEQRVFGSTNDVQFGTTTDTTATFLELGRSGEPVGLRFTDISVPQGATITNAYISFTAYQGDSDTSSLTIQVVDEDDIVSITSSPNLTSGITWSPGSWSATMQRIDIAEDVLSEVFMDRSIAWGYATWAGGNCSSGDDDDSPDYYTDYLVGCHDHDQTHYDALQAHVYDGNTGGCTPLVPTMRGGLEYFQESRSDNYYGEDYTKLSCQPRILVIVTDGYGNTATDNTGIDSVVADLIAEGVSVVAVGFGLTNATQLDRIVTAMQVAGEADDEDDLFHLHNEDADGNAVPFMAQNRQEFIQAMNEIVQAVKAQVFYGSSPAATTSANDDEIGVLVNASFDASDWSGSLSAKEFDAYTGELESTATWTTDTTLTSATTINGFIADSTGTVTAYTNSSITGDNYLCKPLGDIINSIPQLVGAPPYFYEFDSYLGFKYNASVRARTEMAYVASNDGALHAFDISDGTEAWRFYPNAVTADMALASTSATDDMCSAAYCHKFLLDGSPYAEDVYVDHDNDTTNDNVWKTILVTGQGKGGNSYFGLDITYGNDFDAAVNPTSLLWEWTNTELGFATSAPETVMVGVFDEATTSPAGSPTSTLWVTFFGSGVEATSVLQSEKEAYVFAINSWDASSVWEDASGNEVFNVKLSSTELKNDAPASPICV